MRDLIDRYFGGTGSTTAQVVVHIDRPVADRRVRAVVLARATGLLKAPPTVAEVLHSHRGVTVSPFGSARRDWRSIAT